MLDNFTPKMVRQAVDLCSKVGKISLEVSGGVNLENIRAYAESGIDFISVGRLTHSAPALDLSMEIVS
jgi:nicotinate-nucleotide pyrophosphorylase (carboxylating)